MTARLIHRSALAAAVLVAIPGTATAASFYIIESSVSRLGNAFAGTASAAEDASTVFFNGAGMTRLDEPGLQLGGHYIRPEADFENEGSTNNTTGTQLSGSDGNTDDSALVPNFYYATPLNDTVSVGIGFNAPFGLTSKYDDDWVGRYHATNSELETININPSVAFQATDNLSLGFGVNYQSIDATLENKVDASQQGIQAFDGDSRITGDDRSVGFDLSMLYEFDSDTRVGLSWRQGVDYTLEGQANFDRSRACDADAACSAGFDALENAREGDVRAEIELPDIITLSGTHGIGDDWRVDADIAWYEWDSIQQLRIERTTGVEVSTLELEYENTFRYSLGGTYTGLDSTTLRAGVAYDETPISSPETNTPRIPDGDRTWLTVGATFEMSATSSIDVGYAHLFVDEVEVNNEEQGNTLRGEFDPAVDILSVAANWRF